MSRIGKLPVAIPDKVEAKVEGTKVFVKGPKGSITKEFANVVSITLEDSSIVVAPKDSSRFARAMYGTARSIINGMVTGVNEGFIKELEIQGVGFRADLQGKILDLALGKSHEIKEPVPDGVTVTIEQGTNIKIEGPDKQVVGQLAANIKSHYPVEPYKGKGVRIKGEYVRRKEGKKTA
jgi:large subunit ribosomal protein L6